MPKAEHTMVMTYEGDGRLNIIEATGTTPKVLNQSERTEALKDNTLVFVRLPWLKKNNTVALPKANLDACIQICKDTPPNERIKELNYLQTMIDYNVEMIKSGERTLKRLSDLSYYGMIWIAYQFALGDGQKYLVEANKEEIAKKKLVAMVSKE